MNEIERSAELLRQAWRGEAPGRAGWHGPALAALVAGLDARAAASRPIPGAHSIWELVLHVAEWDAICARRLRGERVEMTTGSPGDWPAVEATDEPAWRETLARLEQAQDELLAALAGFDPAELDRQVAGRGWSFYTQIHGTLHHDLYHAGQIALLRKALEPTS